MLLVKPDFSLRFCLSLINVYDAEIPYIKFVSILFSGDHEAYFHYPEFSYPYHDYDLYFY